MSEEKKFRTKTEFCHILEDKIVFTNDGTIVDLSRLEVGSSISGMLVFYGMLALVVFYFAFEFYKSNDFFLMAIFVLFALYLVFGIITNSGNSGAKIIDRKSIQQVKLKKGIAGLTRTRFEIYFYDKNNKIKRRLIMLSGPLTGGDTEADLAYNIMKEEGLV